MTLVPRKESIEAMKKGNISEKEMKETMEAIQNSPAVGLVEPHEIDDFVAQNAAKLLGVSVGERALKSGGGDGRDCVKTTIQKIIHKEIRDVKVCVTGFIKTIEDDVTRSGSPKKNIRLTNSSGTSTVKCAVFDDCLDIFKSLELKELDRIKMINAEIYPFEYKGFSGVILTCGRYTEIKKAKGNFTDKLPTFLKANVDNTTYVSGIVNETEQHGYFGCPECKKKYEDKKDRYCEHCDYEGKPIEYIIIELAVAQGKLDVVVTVFGGQYEAKHLFGKMVTIVGRKKGSRELTANNIRVEGLGLKFKTHGKHFADNDEKPIKPSKKKGSLPSKRSKFDIAFTNTVSDMLNIYGEDGIKLKELIIGINARFSSLNKTEVKTKIEEMGNNDLLKIKNKKVYIMNSF